MNPTQPLLELCDVRIEYPRGFHRPPLVAVDRVGLGVAAGETVALVGESGSGKSSIGNAVLGLVPPARGTIRFDGEDITRATPQRRRALTRDIQCVFQDPTGSLNPRRTIGQTLTERLLPGRLSRADRAERVATALRRVNLDPDAAAGYPAEFSGGQLQRIAIARALMVRPRLIVCDEPTSALDLSVQAQVLNLLTQLQRDLGLGYLFITHDLAVVRHVAHRVVVLHRGSVVESGPTARVCDRPADPYTRRLLDAAPVPDPAEQARRRGATADEETVRPEPVTQR
ncbi:MAG TPA: ATP-binding cassette domain-containing protein [Pseudonocardiaceae bacterium]|jgi:ABC-type microcin C transport system duplicated ATPase subunit YejF